MTKIFLCILLVFLSSCSTNKLVSEQDSNTTRGLVDNAFKSVSENWDLRQNYLMSPAFRLSKTDKICAKFVLFLSSSESVAESFEKQLLYGHGERRYALNTGNELCSLLSDKDFFNILSSDGLDTPDYNIFKIARFIENADWVLGSGVSLVYHDEVSEKCFKPTSELSLLEVKSLAIGEEEADLFDAFEIRMKCRINDKSWYTDIYLADYYDANPPLKKGEVISIDAFPIDNRKAIDEVIHKD